MTGPGEGTPPPIDPTDQAAPAISPDELFKGPMTPEAVTKLQDTMDRVAKGAETGNQEPGDIAALDSLAASVKSKTVHVEDVTAKPGSGHIVMKPVTSYFRTVKGPDGESRTEDIDPKIGKALEDYAASRRPQDTPPKPDPHSDRPPVTHSTPTPPAGSRRTAPGRTTRTPGRETGATAGDGYDRVRDMLDRRHPGEGKSSTPSLGEKQELDEIAANVIATKKTTPSGATYTEYTLVGKDASGKTTETPLPKDVGARLHGHNNAANKAAAKRAREQTKPDASEPKQDQPDTQVSKKTPESRKPTHKLRAFAKENTPRGEDQHINGNDLYAVFGAVSAGANAQKATRKAKQAIGEYYALEVEPPKSRAEAAARMEAAFVYAQEALPRDGSGGVASASVAKVEHIDGKDYLITGGIGNSPIMLWRDGQLVPVGELQEYGGHTPYRGTMADGLGHPDHVHGKDGGFYSIELQPGDMVLLASGGTLSDKSDDIDARTRDLPAQLLREYGDVFTLAATGNGTDAKPAERAAEGCCRLGKEGADKTAILLQYGEVMKPRPLSTRSGGASTFNRTRESFNRANYTPQAFRGSDDARGIYSAYNLLQAAGGQQSPAEAAQQRARLYLESQPQPKDLQQAVEQMHVAMGRSSEGTYIYGNRNDAEGVLTRIVEVGGEPYLVAARAGTGMAAVYRRGGLADAFDGDDLVGYVARDGHEVAIRKLERGDKILIASAGVFPDGNVPGDYTEIQAYSRTGLSLQGILGTEDPRVAAQLFLDAYGQAGTDEQTGQRGPDFREKVAVVIQVDEPDPFTRESEWLYPRPGNNVPYWRGPGLLRPDQIAAQALSGEMGQLPSVERDEDEVALTGLGRAVHWLRAARENKAKRMATKRSKHASVLPGN